MQKNVKKAGFHSICGTIRTRQKSWGFQYVGLFSTEVQFSLFLFLQVKSPIAYKYEKNTKEMNFLLLKVQIANMTSNWISFHKYLCKRMDLNILVLEALNSTF